MNKKNKHLYPNNFKRISTVIISILILCSLSGCSIDDTKQNDIHIQTESVYTTDSSQTSDTTNTTDTSNSNLNVALVPDYNGEPIYEYNNNTPFFTEDEMTTNSYETYYPLDNLGRVQGAIACLGEETLPTEARGNISSIKPTGWQSVTYDCVDGGYLYNRCHLIAYELSAENANECNLTTGTRYMNVEGMLPYENMTRAYIDDTGNHVMYRVTPVFLDNELVCRGIFIEAYSVEDNGNGLQFCIYCYNIQPSVIIDYATGDSILSTDDTSETTPSGDTTTTSTKYILNIRSKTIHRPDCTAVSKIADSNKQEYTGSLNDLVNYPGL